MVGELLAVVIGERVDKVGMRLQYCEQGVRDGLCGLVGSLGNDANAACLSSPDGELHLRVESANKMNPLKIHLKSSIV